MQNFKSQRIVGDWVYIQCDVKTGRVFIGSLFDQEGDDPISISRDKLLQLIDEWFELMELRADQINIKRDKGHNIWLEPIVFEKNYD